jgi:acyl-CoA dehydrogenase
VIKFQVWQHRFADLAVRIRTGKALTYRALRLHVAAENDPEVPREELVQLTSMAKLFTQRLAWQVADECVQVHGGAGALKEYPAQRLWRDARVGPIGGGTDDIMRNIIARTMGLGMT